MGSSACICQAQAKVSHPSTRDITPVSNESSMDSQSSEDQRKSLQSVRDFYMERRDKIPSKIIHLYENLLNGKSESTNYINLRFATLNLEATQQLCNVLPFYKHITVLRLWKYKLPKTGLEMLIKTLKKLPNLEQLSLEDMSIKGGMVDTLATSLPHLKNLRELYLQGNEITGGNIQELITALQKLPKLKFLNLDYNELHGKGCCLLASAIEERIPTLETLSLCFNTITRDAVDSLVSLGGKFPNLHVSLVGNYLGQDCKQELLEVYESRAVIGSQHVACIEC